MLGLGRLVADKWSTFKKFAQVWSCGKSLNYFFLSRWNTVLLFLGYSAVPNPLSLRLYANLQARHGGVISFNWSLLMSKGFTQVMFIYKGIGSVII